MNTEGKKTKKSKMSEKKPEKDRQQSNILRYIIGFGAVALAFYCDKMTEYQTGEAQLPYILLMLGLCVVGLIMLVPLAFRGFPEAIARKSNKGNKPSGTPFSGEALDYFETHPYDTTYTDSQGRGWDNTFFDD